MALGRATTYFNPAPRGTARNQSMHDKDVFLAGRLHFVQQDAATVTQCSFKMAEADICVWRATLVDAFKPSTSFVFFWCFILHFVEMRKIALNTFTNGSLLRVGWRNEDG